MGVIIKVNPDTLKIIESLPVYKDKHEKASVKEEEKQKSNNEFPKMLEEEINKLTEKDNSNLKSRK